MEVLQLGHHPGSKKIYLSQARFCPPCLARTGFFSIETLETKKRTVNKYMFFVENMVGGRLKLDLDLGCMNMLSQQLEDWSSFMDIVYRYASHLNYNYIITAILQL